MKCEANHAEWTIVKRYKDFHRLNSSFYSADNWRHFAGVKRPAFPAKELCFRDDSKLELANKRLVSLDIYLKELISRTVYLSFPDFRAFLEMPLSVRELAHIYYDKGTAGGHDTGSNEMDGNHGIRGNVQTDSMSVKCIANEARIDALCGTIESLMETVHSLKEEIKGLNTQIDELRVNTAAESTGDIAVDGQQNSEIDALREWLRDEVRLPQYIDVFLKNGFENLSVIQPLGVNDLDEMGIEKKGHRLQIVLAIAKLKAVDHVEVQSASKAKEGTQFI